MRSKPFDYAVNIWTLKTPGDGLGSGQERIITRQNWHIFSQIFIISACWDLNIVSVGKLRSSSGSSDDEQIDEIDDSSSTPADALHGVLHISHLYTEGELACMHCEHCHFFSAADAFNDDCSAWHSLHLVPSEFL